MNLTLITKLKRVSLAFFVACFVIGIIVVPACDRSNSSVEPAQHSNMQDAQSSFVWPDRGLATLIPEPPVSEGEISIDAEDWLSVDLVGVTRQQFDDYVSACEEMGYVESYSRIGSWCTAENEEGYSVSANYSEADGSMKIDVTAFNVPVGRDSGVEDSPDEGQGTEGDSATAESSGTLSEEGDANAQDGVSPSLKEAMDSYEVFFDEYIAFMRNYENATDYSPEMLEDFNNYMERYADVMEKLDAIDESTLSPADLAYYTEVMTRIYGKLAEL